MQIGEDIVHALTKVREKSIYFIKLIIDHEVPTRTNGITIWTLSQREVR